MESKILKLAVAVIGMAAFGAFGDIVPTTLRDMFDTNTLYTASQVDQKISEATGGGATTNYVDEATNAVYRAAVDYADAGLANKASEAEVVELRNTTVKQVQLSTASPDTDPISPIDGLVTLPASNSATSSSGTTLATSKAVKTVNDAKLAKTDVVAPSINAVPGQAADAKATGDAIEPLLFAQHYPDGSVKSAAEFTSGIKYDDPDTTNRTITVKPFCYTFDSENDNSNLSGRVVIPPYVDAQGNGYVSDDGNKYKVVGVSNGSIRSSNTNLTAVIAPNTVTNIGYRAFLECASLVDVSFPAAEIVGEQAFRLCTSLASVSLPAGTNIGDRTFATCRALTSVSFPAAETVGEQEFAACTNLTSVSFPAATNIGVGAFASCAALASVDFGDTPRPSVPSLGRNAFNGVTNTCKIIVPDSQYGAWTAEKLPDGTTDNPWYALVTAGYKFLKHSEWEYARRYELEDRVSKTDFNTATNNINTALRSDTLLTPVYTSYNLTIPNTLDDEDTAYSNEVSLVYDDNQGKYALTLGGTRASNYLTSGDGGHTLLYNGGFARAEQLFDLTNGSVVAEQGVLGYVLGSQADKPLASDAALLSSSTGISRFSEATTYAVDSLVFHAGDVWVCSTKHNAGPWNSAHFTRTDVLVNKARNPGSNLAVGNSKISNSNNSVAIGSGSVTANSCVALGYGASVSGYSAVQLGAGANSTPKSLQFRGHQIAVESTVDGRVVCRLNRNLLDLVEPISWTNLVERRNQGRLLPGMEYRITNYVATTSGDMNSQSANHPFDIIVVADSITNLNEHARAVRSDGDTYFAGCNLAAWDVWYCIDNDTNRFAWAVANGGKGVIYRLVDEFQNDVPYDFKGIQFKAYGDTDNVWRYTFDSGDATDNTDYSLAGFYNSVFNNTIVPYSDGTNRRLNQIVFKGSDCYSNTFDLSCFSNTFGSDCYSNTFGSYCYYNTFGSDCYSNTFGSDCYYNTFGSNCYLNTFGSNCGYIKFGTASTVKSYCRYVRIASGNRRIYLNPTGNTSSTAYYQNVEIVEGVNNTLTYKTIDDSNVNQNFKTTYQPVGSQVISIP